MSLVEAFLGFFNRIKIQTLSVSQLKIMQGLITRSVFIKKSLSLALQKPLRVDGGHSARAGGNGQ